MSLQAKELRFRKAIPSHLPKTHGLRREFQQVSLAKRNNTMVARECAKLAREIHGANGISGEYPIMRHLMNMESVYTYEGTFDLHTLILGEDITQFSAFR